MLIFVENPTHAIQLKTTNKYLSAMNDDALNVCSNSYSNSNNITVTAAAAIIAINLNMKQH